jgi:hypothetical protein
MGDQGSPAHLLSHRDDHSRLWDHMDAPEVTWAVITAVIIVLFIIFALWFGRKYGGQ